MIAFIVAHCSASESAVVANPCFKVRAQPSSYLPPALTLELVLKTMGNSELVVGARRAIGMMVLHACHTAGGYCLISCFIL